MKKIFVCSPLRADRMHSEEDNIKCAKQYCRLVLKLGHAPFAPHLLYTQMLDDKVEEDRDIGIQAGVAFLRSCDELWYFGHTISAGMLSEIQEARSHGIPVRDGLNAINIELENEG